MVTTIKSWFQPPNFTDDAEKTRIASLLNTMLWTMAAMMLILIAGSLLTGNMPTSGTIVMGVVIFLILALQIPIRIGRVKFASGLLVFYISAGTASFLAINGTARSSGIIYFVLASVIAGLLISRRAAITTSVINCLAVFILLHAENIGMLTPAVSPNGMQGIAFAVGALMTVILLNLATRSIDDSIALANRELTERIRADKQEQYRSEMLEEVIRIGKAVTEATDFRTVLTRIWDGVRNGLDFDRVGIWLYDSNKNIMTGSYGTDRSGEMIEEWELNFPVNPDSFFDKVLSRQDGFYFTDDYQGVHRLSPGHDMEGVKYNAAVGCWSGDKPVAILSVDKLLTNRPITENQLEALRLFAGYAGLAIQNVRLSEREKYRREILEKVLQLGKTVTEAADFRTTLQRIWDCVRNGFDFDRVGIFIYDPVENIMRGSYGTDQTGKITEEWDVRYSLIPGSLFYNALSRPDGYAFTEDFDGNYSHLHVSIMKGVKQNAVVACWSGDKPIAIIAVDQFFTNRLITEQNLEALRLFAGYAGLAIQNARLNSELEGRVKEREKLITELEDKNAELERFNYTVSHELKSPIVTIKGFLGSVEKDIRENKFEKAQKDFKRISSAADKMHHTLSDLLELSRVGRVINSSEEIELSKLIQEALNNLESRIHNHNVTIKISPGLPILYADRLRLREVFENLIDNAAKYMGDQPSPQVEIGARNGNGEQIIFVKDNGMGIDPQYHSKVFSLFEKLNPASEGTGIGLALVKRIIETHDGRIWVESEGIGKGSIFCFTLPKSGAIIGSRNDI